MPEKVVDIFSPQKVEKKEVKKPEKKEKILPKPEKKPSPVSPQIKIKTPASSIWKKLSLFGVSLLVLAFIFCFFTLSRADIEIWPVAESLSPETTLTIDKNASLANFTAKIMPGEMFEREKTVTENFTASGKTEKEEKAQGVITVYNAYSVSAQTLVANTRFVSADGKIFRSQTKITIPGGNYEGGKLIPGEIAVKVVADEAGAEYNIGPSTFSVPGLAGSDRYTKIYGKSFTQFSGGLIEESSQVTKDDLEKAKEAVTKKAKEECEAAFKEELQSAEISSEYFFLEKAIQTEVVETFSLAKAGDAVANFNYQVKAKSKTLIFSKKELNDFTKNFILAQTPQNKELYEKSLKTDFTPETINLSAEKIILNLKISAKIYRPIDLANLKEGLRGRSLMEAKVFFANQPDISRTQIDFWPFWVTKVPDDTDKINLKISVD